MRNEEANGLLHHRTVAAAEGADEAEAGPPSLSPQEAEDAECRMRRQVRPGGVTSNLPMLPHPLCPAPSAPLPLSAHLLLHLSGTRQTPCAPSRSSPRASWATCWSGESLCGNASLRSMERVTPRAAWASYIDDGYWRTDTRGVATWDFSV